MVWVLHKIQFRTQFYSELWDKCEPMCIQWFRTELSGTVFKSCAEYSIYPHFYCAVCPTYKSRIFILTRLSGVLKIGTSFLCTSMLDYNKTYRTWLFDLNCLISGQVLATKNGTLATRNLVVKTDFSCTVQYVIDTNFMSHWTHVAMWLPRILSYNLFSKLSY